MLLCPGYFYSMVRTILLFILALLSLLTVVRPPEYHLWLLTILITEFPWIPILLTVALLATGNKNRKWRLAGNIAGALALALYISPVVRAYILAGKLDKEMDVALGKHADIPVQPFSTLKMVTGIFAQQDTSVIYFYDGRLGISYFKSHQAGKHPCVVVVHGGSWSGGGSEQLPELNTVLAHSGYNVASINYRLAPFYKSPAQVEDLHKAMCYLKDNADELGIDTTRFVLLGRSAGAQISLCGSYTFHDPCIVGTISYYGPADMVWGYSLPANPLVFDSRQVMIDYLGGTYEQVPQQYFNSSPIEFVTPQSPPTLLIHGPLDPLVAYEHSVRLSNKLRQNHVPYYFLSLPCGTHGCDYTINGPSGQLATYAVLRFLDAVCHK